MMTDVAMPSMSGRELARRIAPTQPQMQVVFASGASDERLGEGGVAPGETFLQKPFTLDALMRTVRAALDRRRVRAEGR